MKNGLLYLLVGGVIGYLGYSYYLKQKQKGKESVKGRKKDEEMLKEEVPLPEMIVVDNTPVKKPIFDPRIARDYDISKQPAQPHLVIYQGVSAPKPDLKITDFVVNKKEPEINYSWLM
jgi:hypothetical protein